MPGWTAPPERTVEKLPALLLVVGSYAGYLLAWRRVRVARGRRQIEGAELLRHYDHAALAAELGEVCAADDTAAAGPRVAPIPVGPLGALPAPWAEAPWTREAPGRLRGARDELLRGLPAEAAAAAAVEGAPPAAIRSLFTWACLHRLFGGELAAAAECAASLVLLDPGAAPLGHRLLARVETVRAELEKPGPAREAACTRALDHLRRGREGGDLPGPAELGLRAHLEVLRLSFWDLEWRELVARRLLRAALALHPAAPPLHLVRAELAAALGDPAGAADHLARALYYARGAPFYAGPIAAAPWVARVRPALAAEARRLLAGEGGEGERNRGPAAGPR